jgi:putative ABC transport system ATP-binding protein
MKKAIITEHLHKSYRTPAGRITIIRDVDLEVEKGESIALVGPSGCGKTTLINLLSGLTRPTSGSITVFGKEIARLPEHFMVEFRRSTVGIVFQQFNLIQGLSALENLTLPLIPLGSSRQYRREIGIGILRKLNLEQRADFPVTRLSGGEQQRIALGRALVNNPDILFCDEPTSNIDRENSEILLSLFQELHGEGKTLVLSTHHPLLLESGLCSKVYDISEGTIDT